MSRTTGGPRIAGYYNKNRCTSHCYTSYTRRAGRFNTRVLSPPPGKSQPSTCMAMTRSPSRTSAFALNAFFFSFTFFVPFLCSFVYNSRTCIRTSTRATRTTIDCNCCRATAFRVFENNNTPTDCTIYYIMYCVYYYVIMYTSRLTVVHRTQLFFDACEWTRMRGRDGDLSWRGNLGFPHFITRKRCKCPAKCVRLTGKNRVGFRFTTLLLVYSQRGRNILCGSGTILIWRKPFARPVVQIGGYFGRLPFAFESFDFSCSVKRRNAYTITYDSQCLK